MRTLLPVAHPAPDLHEVYADGWLDSGGLRVNFVTSADGAMSVHGLSRGLQTPGDNAVFAALRDLADVVLVGAGTARTEGYKQFVASPRRAEIRARYGFRPQLPIALVSGRLALETTDPIFTPVPGAPRPIVITSANASAQRREMLEPLADIIIAGTEFVDLPAARAQLHERGLRRILSEGGPTLFGDLLGVRAVDELCLSLSPILAGAGSGRITAGTPIPVDVTPNLEIISLLEEDHALFYRYRIR